DLPRDDTRNRVFDILATAWAESRKVRIWYLSSHPGAPATPRERLLSPYFLEPNAAGHSCYVIGQESLSGQVRAFKIERIQELQLTDERFSVPTGFDVVERLRQAWGVSDEDVVEVVLRFH